MLVRRTTQDKAEGLEEGQSSAPKPFRSSLRSTIDINAKLLVATGCGLTAWVIWPNEPEWWSLGFLSIILTCGAIGSLAGAVHTMVAAYTRESTITEYMAQGGKAKSSRLATADDLKSAGMLE